MRTISFTLLLSIILIASCGTPVIEFESTQTR
jgi:hypothetical protein